MSLFERDFQGPRLNQGEPVSLVMTCPLLLVAVAAQHRDDLCSLWGGEHASAAKITLPLAGEPHLKMACASAAVHNLTSGCDPKTLLDALVGLLLWHGNRLLIMRGARVKVSESEELEMDEQFAMD